MKGEISSNSRPLRASVRVTQRSPTHRIRQGARRGESGLRVTITKANDILKACRARTARNCAGGIGARRGFGRRLERCARFRRSGRRRGYSTRYALAVVRVLRVAIVAAHAGGCTRPAHAAALPVCALLRVSDGGGCRGCENEGQTGNHGVKYVQRMEMKDGE